MKQILQKCILDEKLNLSLILLFRQSFISQVSNEKISGIQRIIFSRSESNIEMQNSKSILFFIAGI